MQVKYKVFGSPEWGECELAHFVKWQMLASYEEGKLEELKDQINKVAQGVGYLVEYMVSQGMSIATVKEIFQVAPDELEAA